MKPSTNNIMFLIQSSTNIHINKQSFKLQVTNGRFFHQTLIKKHKPHYVFMVHSVTLNDHEIILFILPAFNSIIIANSFI